MCSTSSNCHIKVLTDNATAVEYLRNMGGSHSILCNELAREIWMWYRDKHIWLSVSHIPGVDNVLTDKASRVFDDTTEWKLDKTIYLDITNIWGWLTCLLKEATIKPHHMLPGELNRRPLP